MDRVVAGTIASLHSGFVCDRAPGKAGAWRVEGNAIKSASLALPPPLLFFAAVTVLLLALRRVHFCFLRSPTWPG